MRMISHPIDELFEIFDIFSAAAMHMISHPMTSF